MSGCSNDTSNLGKEELSFFNYKQILRMTQKQIAHRMNERMQEIAYESTQESLKVPGIPSHYGMALSNGISASFKDPEFIYLNKLAATKEQNKKYFHLAIICVLAGVVIVRLFTLINGLL